jgi:glycine cleavage system T protein (aminomethyltransferase)
VAQQLVTNDLTKCSDGQAQYAALCNETGGVIDDVIVYRFSPERLFVCVNASRRAKDYSWMRAHAKGGVEVSQRSDDWAQVAVQGPGAPAIVDSLCEPRVADLGYYHFREAKVAGVPGCIVARTGYTGEDGFEFYVAPDAAPALWEAIAETGAGSGLVPAGLAARDTLRLEAGMPLYGHELNAGTFPVQAGLGRVVALKTKEGDFVGRAAVEEGPPEDAKVLVGLVSEGKRAGRAGYDVLNSEGVVGVITSGALSPTLGYPIAMAYVDAALSGPGTLVDIDVRGSRVAATVTSLPFYKKEDAHD